jgi:hypothetical protein
VGQKLERQQQRYDSTLPAWTDVSPSFVSSSNSQNPPQSTPKQNDDANEPVDDDDDFPMSPATTTTTTNSVRTTSTGFSEEKIRRTVEETIEVSLHKFMAEQQRNQSQQLVIRQQENTQHAQRLDTMERLILKIAESQVLPDANSHKGVNPPRLSSYPTCARLLDSRKHNGEGIDGNSEPEGDDMKTKTQKTDGTKNIPKKITPIVDLNAESSGGGLSPSKPKRVQEKSVTQTTLKVTPKKNEHANTRSANKRQLSDQTPPPKANGDESNQKTSNSAK